MKLLKLTGLTALVLAVALALMMQPAAHADDGYYPKAAHHGYTKYIDDDDGYRAQTRHRNRNDRRYRRGGPAGHLPPPAYRSGHERVPPGHMSPPGLRKGHYKQKRQYRHRDDRYDRDRRGYRDRDYRRDRRHRDDDWDVTIHKDPHGTDVDIRYRKWDH